MDVRLPDGTIVRNVPAGTTQAQLMARVQKASPTAGTGVSGLPAPKSNLPGLYLQGGTFGLSDEASGLAGALTDAIQSPFSSRVDFNPVKSYQAWRDRSRQEVAATRKAHPYAGTALELAGGLGTAAPAKAATGATTMAQKVGNVLFGAGTRPATLKAAVKAGAKTGAASGAVAGFGYGEGTEGSLLGSMLGAGAGSVLGAALPVAGNLLRKPVQDVRNYLDPNNGLGRQVVTRAIGDDKLTPRAAGQLIQEAQQRGSPLMLADMGDNLRGLAGSLSRKPGPSRTLIRTAVEERQAGQGDRVRQAIERDLGPIANPHEVSDNLIQQARTAAAPLYDEAYRAPPVQTPEIDALLNTPAGRAALSRAKTIAANEGRNPQAMGFALDGEGNVILNPTRPDLHGNLAEARSAHDAAQAELDRLQRAARGGAGGTGVPAATRAAQEAADRLAAAEEAVKAAPTSGAAATQPGYTPQTLDYVKRGLDDVVEQHRDPVTRRLNLDEAGRAVNGVRANFLTEIDRLNPAYAQARAAYAGPASANQAMWQGRKALSASADELERMTNNLSPPDQEQFALGLRSALGEALDRRVDGADKVGSLLGTPRKRAALAKAFGGNANFEQFLKTMADERMANETYRSVATGSQTANRLADDEITSDQGLFEDTAGNLLKGSAKGYLNGGIPGMLGEWGKTVRQLDAFGAGQAGQRAREDAAALLSEVDPDILQKAMRDALREQARRRVTRRNGYAVDVRSGNKAGLLSGAVIGANTGNGQ